MLIIFSVWSKKKMSENGRNLFLKCQIIDLLLQEVVRVSISRRWFQGADCDSRRECCQWFDCMSSSPAHTCWSLLPHCGDITLFTTRESFPLKSHFAPSSSLNHRLSASLFKKNSFYDFVTCFLIVFLLFFNQYTLTFQSFFSSSE